MECKTCGIVDATLRASEFRYMVSGVVVSMANVASLGVFCSKHRRWEMWKWTTLTGIFGWWSIAGIVGTPLILAQNLRGGRQSKELNVRILKAAAEELVERGDTPAAVRALEQAARLQPEPDVLARRAELRGY